METLVPAYLPPGLTLKRLEELQSDIRGREVLLDEIVQQFESKYRCTLDELDRSISNQEIAEHPAWEDSIEWRNALEQLYNIQLSKGIFSWLKNWLAQSSSS